MSSCWIEVSLPALRHNYQQLAQVLGPTTQIIAVVKANAYGLGAPQVTQTLAGYGASYFAVTRVDEALTVRQAGVEQPILVMAPVAPEEAEVVVQEQLTATISTLQEALHLDAVARKHQQVARCHLKINTGMNRFGVQPSEAVRLARALHELSGLELEGAYTHFSAAGSADTASVKSQFQLFQELLAELSPLTAKQLFHCANSAAVTRFPAMRQGAVRPGTLLYGQFPTPASAASGKAAGIVLQDPFSVKAKIVAVQQVPAGITVGYGSEWKAKRPSTIAVLACGYADGLTLEPRARMETPMGALKSGLERAARLVKAPHSGRMVSLRGQQVPLVGRIAMQTCTLDVTGLDKVQLGEIVTVPMRRVTAGAHLIRVYTE